MARSSGGHGDGGPSLSIDLSTPALVFAVFYALMLLYYIRRAFSNPTSVFIMLSLFCAIRVTSFVLYAIIEDSYSVEMFKASWVLYEIGIFALVYSAYILVLNREIMSGNVIRGAVSRFTSNKHLIRLLLGLAVVVGIVAFVISPQGNISPFVLQEISLSFFLVVTVLLAIHTTFQIRGERAALGRGEPSGPGYLMYIPCLIVFLLLFRGIYRIVTVSALLAQSEAMWFSLGALPELLAVFLFAVNDLVPEKQNLLPRINEHRKDPEMTGSA